MYKNIFKRWIDFLVALLAIVLLSPLMVFVWLLLCVATQENPLFYQPRPGKDGRIFNIIKFRTMNNLSDDEGNLLPDAVRLTKVGAFIRKTSLDELPQLFNVLNGEMSLIGPRPLRTFYLPLYSQEQMRRHEVRPGITGLAQINGRNAISWKEKFEYDVYYVDNLSVGMDLKIVLLTVSKLFHTKDVNAREDLTMERFNGNN